MFVISAESKIKTNTKIKMIKSFMSIDSQILTSKIIFFWDAPSSMATNREEPILDTLFLSKIISY